MTKKLHATDMKHDRFREGTGKALKSAVPFVQQHRTALIGAAVAFVAVVVGWSVIAAVTDHRREASQDLLAQAVESLQDASSKDPGTDPAAALDKARKAADELVASYPGSAAGQVGQYYQGVVALRQGRSKDAQASLQGFVDAHPAHDLVPQALSALAAAAEDAGDAAAAEKALRRLVDGDWELFPTGAALMDLGRFYERQGRADEAKAIYERLTTEEAFASSPFATAARQRLEG